MKELLIAGFLITFPGLVVCLYLAVVRGSLVGAVASVALNTLPFLVGYLIMKARGPQEHDPDEG